MKKLLFTLLLLPSIAAMHAPKAIIETTISVGNAAGGTYQALLYTPDDYNGTTTRYPLFFFLHGAGESCPPLSNIYTNAQSGGIPYEIEQGRWPTTGFVNKLGDGLTYKFLIVSPQANCNGWSSSGNDVEAMVKSLLAQGYRVDTNRIYSTGLSAGGGGTYDWVAHMDPNEDAPTGGNLQARQYKAAAFVPMSMAVNEPTSTQATVIVGDSIRAWGFGSLSDVYGDFTSEMVDDMNAVRSGFARFTSYAGGHCCWEQFYNPSYRETIGGQSVNIYEWCLQYSRGAAPTTPTASAGSNQTITLPTSTVTLVGIGTPGAGHSITGYAWTKISGTACTITSPTSSTTTITGLTAGTYTFQIQVTNNVGATATSTVTVTVNAAPVLTAIINPASQTIFLPTSAIVLDGSGSTGSPSSYAWSQVSGPNAASILSPAATTTTISGLIQGSYVFQLSLNGGAATATSSVTVNAARACSGSRKYLTPDPGDSTIFITYGTSPSVLTFQPGDTIAFKSSVAYGATEIHGLTGAPGCPITVINEGGQAWIHGYLKFYGAKYVNIDGTGFPGVQYGFKIQRDPHMITGEFVNGVGLQISERSKVITINNVFINHTIFGMSIKQSPDCPDSLNYPNWVMDSITVHDNYIRQVNLEGMYIGDTDPDNGPTAGDPRYVIGCHLPAVLDTIYPRPIRSGHMKIYNNIIDSTGRGGIQLSGHSVSVAEIYNNTLTHDGMNGDEQQGTGISVGMYTHAYIHDNTIRDNLTWGIASLGGSGTNVPLRIENNTLDSNGYLAHYSNVAELRFPVTDTFSIFSTASGIPNNYDFANPIFVKTVTNMDHDSTQFWIKGNRIGKYRAELVKTFPSDSSAIQVFDFSSPVSFQKQGNIICNNTRITGGGPASIFVDQSLTTVPVSTNCGAQPSVTASVDHPTISLPANTVFVSASATPVPPATISSYLWTEQSGPATFTIVSSNAANTNINNLVAGNYTFQVQVTDSGGLTATGTVSFTVNGLPIAPITATKMPFNLKRRITPKH